MKVLFSINSMNCGGAERVISVLANTFEKNGHEVEIVVHNWPKSFYELNASVTYCNLEPSRSGSQFIHRIRSLRKEIKRFNPDMMVSFIADNNIVTCLANLFLKNKLIVCERNDPRRRPEKKFLRIVRNISYKFADGYVFQTTDEAQYFGKKIQNKSKVIINPIDVEKLPDVKPWPREKKICAAGRLANQKRFDDIIKSFANITKDYPDYTLHIYGIGPKLERLQELTKKLGCESKVYFEGRVNNLPDKIKSSEIFIMASEFEGMPNALIEAMSMGLACISSDCPVGGPRELITDGENGLLFPVGDVDSLSKILGDLLANKEKTKILATKAEKTRKRASAQNIYSQWLDYIKTVESKA